MNSFEMTDSNSSSHDVDGQGEGLVGHGGDFRLSHALAQIAALERPATLIAYSVLRAHDLVDDALQDSKFAVIRRLESNATNAPIGNSAESDEVLGDEQTPGIRNFRSYYLSTVRNCSINIRNRLHREQKKLAGAMLVEIKRRAAEMPQQVVVEKLHSLLQYLHKHNPVHAKTLMALLACDLSRSRAAEALGVSRHAFRGRVQRMFRYVSANLPAIAQWVGMHWRDDGTGGSPAKKKPKSPKSGGSGNISKRPGKTKKSTRSSSKAQPDSRPGTAPNNLPPPSASSPYGEVVLFSGRLFNDEEFDEEFVDGRFRTEKSKPEEFHDDQFNDVQLTGEEFNDEKCSDEKFNNVNITDESFRNLNFRDLKPCGLNFRKADTLHEIVVQQLMSELLVALDHLWLTVMLEPGDVEEPQLDDPDKNEVDQDEWDKVTVSDVDMPSPTGLMVIVVDEVHQVRRTDDLLDELHDNQLLKDQLHETRVLKIAPHTSIDLAWLEFELALLCQDIVVRSQTLSVTVSLLRLTRFVRSCDKLEMQEEWSNEKSYCNNRATSLSSSFQFVIELFSVIDRRTFDRSCLGAFVQTWVAFLVTYSVPKSFLRMGEANRRLADDRNKCFRWASEMSTARETTEETLKLLAALYRLLPKEFEDVFQNCDFGSRLGVSHTKLRSDRNSDPCRDPKLPPPENNSDLGTK